MKILAPVLSDISQTPWFLETENGQTDCIEHRNIGNLNIAIHTKAIFEF